MADSAIRTIIPLGFQWETTDPFLFCVHHEDFYPEGNDDMGPNASLQGRDIGQDFVPKDGWRMYHGDRVPGFPRHPHRGFETVTIVRRGFVDHTDSFGGVGRYGEGDVQWMTAGSGVQHAEMFPLLNKDSKNTAELFQIWLNLPKANKFAAPSYKMLWSENIPVYTTEDSTGKLIKITLAAGAIENKKAPSPPPDSWAANQKNMIQIWTIELDAGAVWTLPAAEAGLSRNLYYFLGSGLVADGQEIPEYHRMELNSDRSVKLVNGNEVSQLLLLQGRPIQEPVVQYGPFVMNSREEIHQAFSDYQQTEFGGWPIPESDPVHPRDKGRFAKHPDGRVENPGA
ncbi:MAG: pirin family protein [FCB group bacterium]|nr:pirin family protein [FCB group bacterium]